QVLRRGDRRVVRASGEEAEMANVVSIDPFCCRLWKGHERIEEHINERTCRDEIASMSTHGQRIPVLARPLAQDLGYSHELIYGARRLFVARYLKMPLLAEVRSMSDIEAVIAFEIENEQRRELSAYERAQSYRSWLRSGIFESQEDMARTLHVSTAQVSRLLELAQLPPVIVNAFASPVDICEAWGCELMQMWGELDARNRLVARARLLSAERDKSEPAVIYQRLVSNLSSGRRSTRDRSSFAHDEVIKDDSGRPLFRVRVRRREIALLLPAS